MSTNVLLLNSAIGVVLPLLVALITHWNASGAVKSLLLALLSAIAGVITPEVVGANTDWRKMLLSVISVFGTSVLAHYGVLKPAGVTGSAGVIQRNVQGGIGAPAVAPVEDDVEQAPDPAAVDTSDNVKLAPYQDTPNGSIQ